MLDQSVTRLCQAHFLLPARGIPSVCGMMPKLRCVKDRTVFGNSFVLAAQLLARTWISFCFILSLSSSTALAGLRFFFYTALYSRKVCGSFIRVLMKSLWSCTRENHKRPFGSLSCYEHHLMGAIHQLLLRDFSLHHKSTSSIVTIGKLDQRRPNACPERRCCVTPYH